MPNGKKTRTVRQYKTESGVTYEIMPDGSKRKMSREEASSNPAINRRIHPEGSLGSKNNNPHPRGSQAAFLWNKKYGDTPPEITMSENAPSAAKLRNMDQIGMLDAKNEEYIKEQRRQSSPFKSVYDMTENVGDKVVDKINVLGEQGREKLDQASEKIKETSEKLKNLGKGVRDRIKRTQ